MDVVALNSNSDETIWWQTLIHILLFPILFILFILLSGILYYFFADLDSFFVFITRAFQYGACSHLALVVPTLFLKKSNEVVSSTVVGTVIGALSALILSMPFIGGYAGDYAISEWLEIIGSSAGALIGIIAYYSGER